MKKLIFFLLLSCPGYLFSQIGLKAGLNFANVTNASSVNNSSRSGFHAGLFLAPPSAGIMGYRTEVLFSRQGYNYKTGTQSGGVNLDYIMLPQLMCINITKFFQIQFGGHMAFLINAKVDSSGGTGISSLDQLMDIYNKFDYGYGGGIEIHPVMGLIIGARFNISLANLYNFDNLPPGTPPSFIPKVDVKNNVFQVFAGWKFGGNKKQKKEKEK